MKKYLKKALFILPITLVLSFILVFFGYFKLDYDVVIHTDNVVGEGVGSTYVCKTESFSPFYKIDFNFNSKMKSLIVEGIHYDVKYLQLIVSNIEQIEIDSYDIYFKGIKLSHFEAEDRVIPGKMDGLVASITEDGQRARFVFDDPNVSNNIWINTHFAPTWFWIAYVLIILLFAFVFALIISIIIERAPGILKYLIDLSAIGLTILVGCFFCGSLPYVDYTCLLLNWLLLFCLALLLNGLTLNWLGTILTMLFTTFWYIANYFVISLRNKPIMPSDLKAIGTAKEVMGGYTFVPSWKMIVGVIVIIVYAIGIYLYHKKHKNNEKISLKKNLINRGISVAIASLLFVIGINTNVFKNLNSFAWDAMLLKSFHQEGMVLTYLKSAFSSRVKMPEGYSKDLINNYLIQYQKESEEKEGIKPVNIIMVMNEAFSDLREVGLIKDIDVMPYIDSLDENVIEGSLYVSVYGGGTCNSEFEALTGNTLAFFGNGAYPYTENITDQLFSLASYFKELGYNTEAFHANEATNWNRNIVYPNLGFDSFKSIDDYEEGGFLQYLHKQPADISDYSFIQSEFKKNDAKNQFLFNVTMQNHSGYERWEDVKKAESVEEFGSQYYLDTQIYLSLVKASDDSVKELVEFYKTVNEPTMIIFFGDHQPGLPSKAQSEIYTSAESYLDYYKSKFFIWTNYETETIHDAEISANYLPYLILDRGNFELPPYVKMLKELHEKYPIISAMGVKDTLGNIYGSVNELGDDPLIKKYECVQYANIFDEINDDWFKVK